MVHFHYPSSFLYQKLQHYLEQEQQAYIPPSIPMTPRRPGPEKLQYSIPSREWPIVLRRVIENQEPLRKVADDYGVSYETVRRVVRAARKDTP